jgi:NhaP-type Na+/H+ or K+/H+ antiporter
MLMFVVSIVIGVLVGVLCAYVKYINIKILKIKEDVSYETEHIEVSVTVIIPWVCYLIS